MFNLASQDLNGKILDCASGPASFNAEANQKGYRIISCDPLYRFTSEEIASRIHETYETIVDGARANQDRYVWKEIGSPEYMGEIRMAAMRRFLEDFPLGLEKGRYRPDELPSLGFNAGEFDLALSSHFLFTYSEQFSAAFHIVDELRAQGHYVETQRVLYEFQRGGNRLLLVRGLHRD